MAQTCCEEALTRTQSTDWEAATGSLAAPASTPCSVAGASTCADSGWVAAPREGARPNPSEGVSRIRRSPIPTDCHPAGFEPCNCGIVSTCSRRLGGRTTGGGSSRPRVRLGGLRGGRTRHRGCARRCGFVLACLLTAGWVGFAIWASGPWRDDLDPAIGPVMAWVIPLLLAYIPGLVIGFMASTLIVSPYHGLELDPPTGPWPEGEWPPSPWSSRRGMRRRRSKRRSSGSPKRRTQAISQVVLADNNSTDRTAEVAEAAAARLGLDYRRVFEPEPGKFHALNPCSTRSRRRSSSRVDADTYLYPDALTYLVARVTDGRRISTSAPAPEHSSSKTRPELPHPDAAMGLSARDQWRQADAGRVQQRPGRPGRVLRLLDRRRPRRWVAGRTRSARTSCSPGR